MRTENQLRDALQVLAKRTPDAYDVLGRLLVPSAPARAAHRWRPLLMAAGVGLALVLVVTIALPHRRQAPQPQATAGRVRGNWSMVSHVEPPVGWSTAGIAISGSFETSVISDATGKGVCWVETDGPGVAPRRGISPLARPAKVGGQPALYEQPPAPELAVHWHYRAEAWASVSCSAGPKGLGGARTPQQIRQLILHLADTVTFGDYPVRLPIRIKQLPVGYRVEATQQDAPTSLRDWGITLSPTHASSTSPTFTIGPNLGSGSEANTRVGKYPASFFSEAATGPFSREPRKDIIDTFLCIFGAPVRICISAPSAAQDDPERHRKLFHDVASQITYAARPTDPRTWFDARTALPK